MKFVEFDAHGVEGQIVEGGGLLEELRELVVVEVEEELGEANEEADVLVREVVA